MQVYSQYVANYRRAIADLHKRRGRLRVCGIEAPRDFVGRSFGFAANVTDPEFAVMKGINKCPNAANRDFFRVGLLLQISLDKDKERDEGLKACDHRTPSSDSVHA
jgi:hypothetical protein